MRKGEGEGYVRTGQAERSKEQERERYRGSRNSLRKIDRGKDSEESGRERKGEITLEVQKC